MIYVDLYIFVKLTFVRKLLKEIFHLLENITEAICITFLVEPKSVFLALKCK